MPDAWTGLSATQHGLLTHSGSSGLLAVVSYTKGTDTPYTTTSTSYVDVDATNLAVTFTAPASGNVLVRLTGTAQMGAANNGYWGLREASTTIKQGLAVGVTNAHGATVAFHVTGLTPSSSYTYKWAWKVSTNTQTMFTGPAHGPNVMEVWACP